MSSRLAPALACLALAAGCGASGSPGPPTKAGAPVLQPVGMRVFGLGYNQSATLTVRYLDATGQPGDGVPVRFALSDAPGASLSSSREVTAAGYASVMLTAGAAEASFRVTASAPGAADLDFDIAVSHLPFVALDVQLGYGGAAMGRVSRLHALLYDTRGCGQLGPAGTPPKPLRQLDGAAPAATLHFDILRAGAYAAVGRAVDDAGHLVAWGCVDLLATPAGAPALAVAIPLAHVLPSLGGRYDLVTTFTLPSDQPAAWEALTACPAGPAQPLLDALGDVLGPGPLETALSGARAAPDGKGCRPLSWNGAATLDGAIAPLFQNPNTSATPILAALADLRAAATTATLASTLELTPAGTDDGGGDRYLAAHRLVRLDVTGKNGAHRASYDPAALGFPRPAAGGVPVLVDESGAHLGPHGLTLRLPVLWGRAADDVALAPQKLPADPRMLLAAWVAGALRDGPDHPLSGCAAVEDAFCERTGAPRGAIAPACERALDVLARGLAGAFDAPAGYDLVLTGNASLTDDGGDLTVDRLAGTFTADVAVSAAHRLTATLPLAGTRAP